MKTSPYLLALVVALILVTAGLAAEQHSLDAGSDGAPTIELQEGGQFVFWMHADGVFAADIFSTVTIAWLFGAPATQFDVQTAGATGEWVSYIPALGQTNFALVAGAVIWVVSPRPQTISIPGSQPDDPPPVDPPPPADDDDVLPDEPAKDDDEPAKEPAEEPTGDPKQEQPIEDSPVEVRFWYGWDGFDFNPFTAFVFDFGVFVDFVAPIGRPSVSWDFFQNGHRRCGRPLGPWPADWDESEGFGLAQGCVELQNRNGDWTFELRFDGVLVLRDTFLGVGDIPGTVSGIFAPGEFVDGEFTCRLDDDFAPDGDRVDGICVVPEGYWGSNYTLRVVWSRDGIVFDEFDFTIDTTDALFLQNGLTSFTPANPQTQSGLYTVAFSGRRSSNTDFQEIGEVSMEITVP